MKLSKCLSVFAVSFVCLAAAIAKDVKLQFSPSTDAITDPSISYTVFVYTNSTVDPNSIFATIKTPATNVVVTNLAVGTRYWANVVATDTNGLSSDFSNTASFIYPGAPTSLHIVP